MRFARTWPLAIAAWSLAGATPAGSATLHAVHQQRYAMGTMFDIVAYHPSREDAERAVGAAMAEILRLDQVLSHFKPDSDLAKLNRDARKDAATVDPALYEVILQSLDVSRRSNGTFDVTIAPLLGTWKRARAEGRRPSLTEIAAAQRCVGYERVEPIPPNRIRFRSDCVEIELGGIGKGYAVGRAIAILRSAGIADAMVNGGSSSIAAIGAPPGHDGWPVRLGAKVAGGRTLLLRDASISTSQQNPSPPSFEAPGSGDIVDPHTGVPVAAATIVSVIGPDAAVADALSTTLLMLPLDRAAALLAQFGDVSAVWISGAGELTYAYRASRLRMSDD